MTPSSPDIIAALWQPQELTVQVAPPPQPAMRSERAVLFEVSPTAGIPDAVLAPARLAAESAGYVAGWNDGSLAGLESAAADAMRIRLQAEREAAAARGDIDRALQTLADAARAFETRAVAGADEVENLVVSAAFEIAEALVGVTLADDEARGRAAVARALALAPRGEHVLVTISPADQAVITAHRGEFGHGVEIITDPTLRAGDSAASFGASSVDARISAGLERVRELLASDGRS